MSSHSTLDEFQDVEHPEPDVELAEPPSPSEVTIEDIRLPDRDFDWADEVEQILDGVPAVVKPEGSITVRGDTFVKGTVAYIAAGLDEYLTEYGDKELKSPTSLDQPDQEIQTYVSELTTSGQSTVPRGERWGRGISPRHLKNALAIAVGDKPYRASEVTVTACGEYGFVVQHRGDAFIVAPRSIGDPGRTVSTVDIDGIVIENEEDETVLNGFRAIKQAINQDFEFNITGFEKRTADKLVFETDHPSGKTIWFSGNQLKRATNPSQDLDQFDGEYEYQARHTDETVEYTLDASELRHTPDEFEGSTADKYVLGYQKLERRVARGTGDKQYGVGVKILAQPYYLKVRPDAYDDRINVRIYGSKTRQRMVRIPFAKPDYPTPSELDSPSVGFQ